MNIFNEKIGHCRKKIECKNGKVFDEKTGQCEEKKCIINSYYYDDN